MHTPQITHPVSYYDVDTKGRFAIGGLVELVAWCGGLIAVLIAAAALLL
jgi:hypothetical protein